MTVRELPIAGLYLITPKRFGDARGWLSETWNLRALQNQGLYLPEFVQDNHSYSGPRLTLRGMHFQRPPRAQDKLVRCTRGAALDVAVDIRRSSSTYGQWVSVELSAENGSQLFVPKGFLHGFLTLTDDCEVQYKCSDYYAPAFDEAVRWDSLGIPWGTDTPFLSTKDAKAIPFSTFVSPFE